MVTDQYTTELWVFKHISILIICMIIVIIARTTKATTTKLIGSLKRNTETNLYFIKDDQCSSNTRDSSVL